ncbi:MAG: hypothetical protein QXR09_01290 [Candidatus Aenigmatarchaeota archaeon]
MVEYPKDDKIPPGCGLNIQLKDCNIFLDIDSNLGKASGVLLALIFQLPKWGFERVKIDEKIVVSPVFQQYYQLTLKQKEELEAIIKAGLASIATAFSDLELLRHDLRKYKEFMDYYKMIEVGKKKKDDKLRLQGEQSLKAIFIDQVDAHTDLPNQPIALRSIAARWPTIIADFMKLDDEDVEPKKIAEKHKVSEAEAVILATKNKLYKEWRDELFKKAVEERFKSLIGLVEARKKSYEEYKEMLKPTLRRYKSIVDGLSDPAIASLLERAAFWKPESQAMSLDIATIWAWKPFAAPDKYKAVRETPLDKIPAEEAGFTPEEIEELKEEGLLDKDGMVKALPVEPSIDEVVRKIIKAIENSSEYKGIKITAKEIFKARERLVNRFEKSVSGLTDYEAWVFSPYFMFFEIPVIRAVIRLPNGTEIEDLMFDRLTAWLETQNIIIGRLIELEVKDKKIELYLKQMLGEAGVLEKEDGGKKRIEIVDIDELVKEYTKKFEEERKEKVKEKGENPVERITKIFEKFFEFFGLELNFFRAKVPYKIPYEFALKERITKYYLREVAAAWGMIVNFIKSSFGAP